MRSVLEFIGAYLYIMWRIAELPLLSLVYFILAMLAIAKVIYHFTTTLPKRVKRSIRAAQEFPKQVFQYGHKLQSWVLQR